ncbi:phosphatase [filamentous cyanobacterium CCP1]|nr:phosphatase [filamentous cyanobacterium CCP2]PSB68086.1 phosphatase [filamentous cyanobacterium CCP1]
MLELHCHTTHSDGTLTPAQLVEAALAAGVKVLAITDHDTLSGWDEAFTAAGSAVEIVPGLELSTVWNGRSLHILGFYPDREKLQTPLQERIAGRHRRAQQMLEKLADLGYPIDLPALESNMAPGRPHIAAALVNAGYVQSMQEAFDRFLGDEQPAYVEYEKFSAIEGIRLLRSCHAVPVWAHPYLFRGGTVEQVLPELVEAGLMGIEVYHPSHSTEQRQRLEALCQEYRLLMTGGSDFHAPSSNQADDRHYGLNQLHLSDELLFPLKQAALDLRNHQG